MQNEQRNNYTEITTVTIEIKDRYTDRVIHLLTKRKISKSA